MTLSPTIPPGAVAMGGDAFNVTREPGVFDLPGTSSYGFDGSTSYVQLQRSDARIVSLRRRITVAAWVRNGVNDAIQRGIFFIPRVSTNSKLYLYKTTAGTVGWGGRSDAEGFQGIPSTSILNANQWHLIAGDMDIAADRLRVYMDGELDNEGSVAFTDIVLTSEWEPSNPGRIGNVAAGIQHFFGRIAVVYVWDRLLDLHEHRELWKLGKRGVIL